MVEFLTIAVSGFVGMLLTAPVTVPMLAAALLLLCLGWKTERAGAFESRRLRRWICVQSIPSVMIVIGGAVATLRRGLLEDELAAWLLFWLLSQLVLAAIGCWRCPGRWRSILAAALGLGAYSLGASIASIFGSLDRW